MTDSAAFWDRHARKYAARPVSNPDAYETTLERVRAHLHRDDHAIEIGAGTGTTGLKLADSVGSYEVTDISPEMIAIANEKIAVEGVSNLTARVAKPGDGSLGTGPADVVLAFNLLHLMPDAAATIAEARNMLKPGGLFISKTPCVSGWFRLIITPMQWVGKAPYVRYLRTSECDHLIADAGFDIVETGNYPATSRFVVARKR